MKTTFALITALILSLAFSHLHAQRAVIRTTSSKVVVNKKTRTVRITKLPKQHSVIVHKRVNYYFFDGYYHTRVNGVYKRIVAPTGLIITELPAGAKRIVYRNKVYYSANGIVYKRVNPYKYKVVII